MRITDLQFVIENPSGSYKKFADSLDEYPLLGVTYPTHYGYIDGYKSEDGHDLDVFIGNGSIFGILKVNRDDAPNGVDTKMLFGINQAECDSISKEFEPVIEGIESFDSLESFLKYIQIFKN